MGDDFNITSEIRALVQAWDGQVSDDEDSGIDVAIRVSPQAAETTRFHLIWGYTAHCFSLADAVLGLTHRGYVLESIPLIRFIYETGVTAYWVAAVEDGVLGMFDHALRTRRTAAKDFMKVDVPEVRKAGETLMSRSGFEPIASPSRDRAGRFQRMCQDFEESDLLYANYRALSTFSHPSLDIVAEYVKKGTRELRLRPRMDEPGDPRAAWTGMALQGLVLATVSLTPYLDDQDIPLVRRVAALVEGSSIGLIPTLTEIARERVARADG